MADIRMHLRRFGAGTALLLVSLVPVSVATATPAECNDAVDNDADGFTDYPNDPNCSAPEDNTEAGECQDGIDNDGDGAIDHPNDPDCSSAVDPIEAFVHGDPPPTHITIRYAARVEVFKGAIGTSHKLCISGRHVTLKKAQRGPDRRLGEDLTSEEGIWRIPWDARRGRYYAVVRAETRMNAEGQEVDCLPDRSVTIEVR